MNISLTPELEAWIASKVDSGRYKSVSEVVREGLRLLEEQDQLKALRRERLRQLVDEGVADLHAGRGVVLDEDEMPTALDLAQVDAAMANGAMMIDGRAPEDFARGHLAGAVNVGLAGRYAEFAGSVIPSDVDIVLFVEPGFELEAKNRLARIGFDLARQRTIDGTRKFARRQERRFRQDARVTWVSAGSSADVVLDLLSR